MKTTSKLTQALQLLELISEKENPILSQNIKESSLYKATEAIDFQQATSTPKLRPDLAAKWQEARQNGSYPDLSNFEVRQLCWTREIALSSDFWAYMASKDIKLSRSSIKGIAYSLAESWTEVLSGNISLESVKVAFRELCTTEFFSKIEPYVFDLGGHRKFAETLLKRRTTISEQFMSIFGVSFSSNQFSSEVIDVIATESHSLAVSEHIHDIDWFFENILYALDKRRLLVVLEHIVPALDGSMNDFAKDRMKEFVLNHPNLGDPRLPGFESNWDSNSKITRMIMEWLSQSDIKFFFELFIQSDEDKQGRKKFWLQYAHLVRGTRVVVSENDRRRLFRTLIEISQKYNNSKLLASLLDKSEPATVFLMDFGNLKVVEFSLPNNACYFYASDSRFEYHDRSRFWNTEVFSVRELKDQRNSSERLSHQDGWEGKFQRTLARFGIRPRYSLGGFF